MKLLRLYTNLDEVFEPVIFRDGLNFIVGEIRLAKNLDKDTHNLGKSTIGKLIDYCLLAQRDNRSFLYSHQELFEAFDFYLAISVREGECVTIRRSVRSPKISIHRHECEAFDARSLQDEQWLHPNLDFTKAKKLLDGVLALEDLRPWDYRKVLPYLLREQSDYTDVFEPHKFAAGKDSNWKPFTLHILGYDYAPFEEYYDCERQKADAQRRCAELSSRFPDGSSDLARIDALLDAKTRDVEEKRESLDRFSFYLQDAEAVDELVDDDGLDAQIAELNQYRYELRSDIAKLSDSLKRERILYSDEEAARLFEEAGIFFAGQVRKDFEQLLSFNREITGERRRYLQQDLRDARSRLEDLDDRLEKLDLERSRRLRQIEAADAVQKYKDQSQNLVRMQADIEVLKAQRENARLLEVARQELDGIEERMAGLVKQMRQATTDVIDEEGSPLFIEIRRRYSGIIKEVLNKYGVLTVTMNSENHADLRAGFQGMNRVMTSEDEGDTYKKLQCVAFDLAILGAHGRESFPSFVYHDDVFGSLDSRKKRKLLDVMRRYANEGIQQIVTVIDSDFPDVGDGDFIRSEEIVLTLHDDGESGQLFKMPTW